MAQNLKYGTEIISISKEELLNTTKISYTIRLENVKVKLSPESSIDLSFIKSLTLNGNIYYYFSQNRI